MKTVISWAHNRIHQIKEKLLASPIAYRLSRAAFWSVTGGVVSRGFLFVSSIIMARLLGKMAYGEIGMITSTVGVFGILSGFGLGTTSTKYIAELRYEDRQRAGNILKLVMTIALISGSIMMCVCIFTAPLVAKKVFHYPQISLLLAFGSILLLISSLEGVQTSTLAGFELFNKIARINIFKGILTPILMIPLVLMSGTYGAVASFILIAAIGLILSGTVASRALKTFQIPRGITKGMWRELPILWKFALPTFASGLVYVFVGWLANAILVNQPGGAGELGVFNAANQWRMVIIFIPTMLMSAMLPVYAEAYGKENKADFHQTIKVNMIGTLSFALPLVILIMVFSKQIALIYGRQFSGVDVIIYVLMLSHFLNILNMPIGLAITGAGKAWIGVINNVLWGIVLIGLTVVLTPRIGALGLAVAYVVSYVFLSILQVAFLEFKLAPHAIRDRLWMIIFSFLLVATCAALSYFSINNILFSVILLVLSLYPVSSIFTKKTLLLR